MPNAPQSYSQRLAAVRQSRHLRDQRYRQTRGARFGPDPRNRQRWQRLRGLVLAAQPLCADPFGIHQQGHVLVPATEVDHIQGIWDAPELVFDRENLQGLCQACHARKTQAERR